MSELFALVDCNNFYASCETLFQPKLRRCPIVVLSNNDGCVVARSKSAKQLGIKMGVPVHQINSLIRQHGIAVFSSNYELYGDMSQRVMSVLEQMAPAVEIYSIDEAFLSLTGLKRHLSLAEFGLSVRERVQRWTGITVCVGIAPSKTLAKLANHAAKTYPATGGVVDLSERTRQQRLMEITPIEEVWGVGRQLSTKLRELGIQTALDLAEYDLKSLRQRFSVVLERTARELRGESCLALNDVTEAKQQIVCSRSFSQRIDSLTELREPVAFYTARACEKLRTEKQVCRTLSVSIRTGQFNPSEPTYSNSITTSLAMASNDSNQLITESTRLLEAIWRPGYRYAKASIMLSELSPQNQEQAALFVPPQQARRQQLMETIDKINGSKHGKVFVAAQGIKQEWSMKRRFLSPAYTTRWSELPYV
ncbi:nucleotidyltransferase/DNA polymerase involved in DNA repair [Spongiibacter sp. IMCC21906]|uniref:translesion error-prone DNA polymerase V subunit UmuC n=1 Tax=Spongiibacter sp. IMCC21906 TaxID=1620392 RepID=UPI00062E0412|nr:translesion error-prone DNA polymerase V subunit UmuC [Spongiibacter sp. IMCC21906]AKH69760.1 nucleotidyltransferase/DNA polymerase involved in DNA repair [Spongiibacter sp. IMCC21906]